MLRFLRLPILALLFTASFSQFSFSQARLTLTPAFEPFYHGVASGDPTHEKVIIWTRCTPNTGVSGNLDVYWQMATDTNFTHVVNFGYTQALPENDYTVKVDVCGLQPNTWYYYMFQNNGKNSITGRTRTAPLPTSDNDSARFAVVSCASWEHGFFNAYQNIADRNEVDAVVHVGDYIYEYGVGQYSSNIAGRTYEPTNEIITENDYRVRHSLYKLDNQLKRCHQMFPFINVWDDHEFADNSWKGGANNHQSNEGSWYVRKNNSVNAYYEWIPIRRPDLADTFRIFRNFKWGKLMNLVMLDSRIYDRSEQDGSKANDTTHHLLGPYQMNWMLQQLSDTSAKWKVIGNQVMFAPFKAFGAILNDDQWDGYAIERTRVENHIVNNNIKNVVVLTGDIHTSWANDIPGANYNSSSGAGSVGVEFVGTSVTSKSMPFSIGVNIIKSFNPHMKYINLVDHGYYTLDVKKNKVQADYRFLPVDKISNTETSGESWYVNGTESFLRKANAQVAAPKVSAPIPALFPNNFVPFAKVEREIHVTTAQNNPLSIAVIPNAPACPAIGLQIIENPVYGTAVAVNNKDVLYTPIHNYSGYDTVLTLVCQTANPTECDTIPVLLQVTAVTKADTVNVSLTSGQVYSNCKGFDDLFSTNVAVSYEGAYTGTVSISNDSCISYTPLSTFCGYEEVYLIGCENNQATVCDTVVYIFRVGLPVVKDVVSISVKQNDTIIYCIQYNDLESGVASSQVIVQPNIGNLNFINDTCFSYTSSATGQTVFVATGCDNCNVQNCDTIEVQLNIVPGFSTQTFTFSGSGGTAIPICYSFDEVNQPFNNVNIIKKTNALIQVQSDTCFNYYAPNGYTGVDTVYAIACNSNSPTNCDTVRLIIYVGVSSIKTNDDDFAMLGIYPNPFVDGLVLQYYNYKQTELECNIFDASGRRIKHQILKGNAVGLQHTLIRTDELSTGSYIIELRDKNNSYRRQLVKQ